MLTDLVKDISIELASEPAIRGEIRKLRAKYQSLRRKVGPETMGLSLICLMACSGAADGLREGRSAPVRNTVGVGVEAPIATKAGDDSIFIGNTFQESLALSKEQGLAGEDTPVDKKAFAGAKLMIDALNDVRDGRVDVKGLGEAIRAAGLGFGQSGGDFYARTMSLAKQSAAASLVDRLGAMSGPDAKGLVSLIGTEQQRGAPEDTARSTMSHRPR